MPYRVRHIPVKGDKDYAIQKKEGGSWKIVGRSTSPEKAHASISHRKKGAGEGKKKRKRKGKKK